MVELTFTPDEKGVIAIWDKNKDAWFDEQTRSVEVFPPFSSEVFQEFLSACAQKTWGIKGDTSEEDLRAVLGESDEDYRDRIAEALPEGAWYSLEDIRDASGEALDALGESHGVKRK